MGYRTSLDISAKCPLYEGVVRTGNGAVSGVQCQCICDNFGFDVSTIIRCTNFQETVDLKELFCDDRYKYCPYYLAWCEAHKKRGQH